MLAVGFYIFTAKVTVTTGIGAALIVASVIMNTRFYFHDNLFNYILMLVMMVGGAGLVLIVLFRGNKKEENK